MIKEIIDKPEIKDIVSSSDAKFGKDEKLTKKVSIYLCHKYSGRPLKEIGEYFGISESGVSQTSKRLRVDIDKNRKLRKQIEIIKKKLVLSNV